MAHDQRHVAALGCDVNDPSTVIRFAERSVTRQLLQGRSRAQIARTLDISEHTVGDHLSSIYAKAGVASRAELCGTIYDRFYAPMRGAAAHS